MDSIQPLYRQLTSRFYLLALSFFLLFFVGFSLYFQYVQDLVGLKSQQFPAIEQHSQRQLLLNKNDRLLNNIITSQSPTRFDEDYQSLKENLKNITKLSQYNRLLLEQLTHRLQIQAENISRLSENNLRNLQLKDSVIIQLTLVADSLSNLITDQTRQQKVLYRQINQEKSTARIAIVRAKELSSLVDSLYINRELQQGIIDTLVMFNQVDLQYDLVEFDYIQQKIQSVINYFLENSNDTTNKTIDENALIEQVTALNKLLFNEQNTFAKWRGQLRMAADFQAVLIKQRDELSPLLDKPLVLQPLKSSNVEQQLLTLLAKGNIDLQPKHYVWFIGCVFVLLAIIFISLIFSLRRKVQRFGVQSTDVVEKFVATGEVLVKVPGVEVTQIINSIKQLSKPLHSEADFQEQQKNHQMYTALMSRHTGKVFWQLPTLSKKQQQQLRALLGIKFTSKHWRKCFSRVDVLAILTLARQAKKNNSVERISLISNQKKAIALTIEYIEGAWCGSLCNAEKNRALKDEKIQLQEQIQQQNQADKLAIIANSKEALSLTNNVLILRQMLSLTQGDEPLVYQLLQKLVRLNEQYKTRAQLRVDHFVLTLSTVSLANEMHTALTNVSLTQVKNNNHVYLNMADNLAATVTLESELFQSMITTICQEMLTDQYGVELNVNLQVVDVNSAQQTVKMSFVINKASHVQTSQRVINALALSDEISTDLGATTYHYLQDLELVFNVSNKISESLDLGGKFSFTLPFAVAGDLSQPSKDKAVKLAKCSILVIATDKLSRERICQQFSDSKALVETMQDLSLFQRQISIKHLTKNRLDVVILSPEVYYSDYDLITQHLASLPAKVQPKIMVIQPFNCGALKRTGFFSVSNLPWYIDELITSVAQILTETNNINLSVEPEIFSPYRFSPSLVEVLLGVSEPNKYGVLIRILHWLGLQVTLASGPAQLERLWLSGRFSVVISEFPAFDFNTIDSLNAVRGVFALQKNSDNKQDFFDALNLPKLWYGDYLAPALDIQKLTQQLSPWLKSDISMGEGADFVTPRRQQRQQADKINTTQSPSSVKADVISEPVLSMAEIEQPFDFPLDLEPESELTGDAFDLSKYAQNQGSAELAAFMIDEYLADISANTQALSKAIDEQNYDLAEQILQSLIKLAKVIAATPLLTQCEELSQMIIASRTEGDLSPQQKEALQGQLNQLKLCLVQLTEFAEAI